MPNNPIQPPLPADLPENWTNTQTIAAAGADVGLSKQHGYNYLMQQVNAAQSGVNSLGTALGGITPASLGAVPTSRTVNGKALSADITLTAEDVGAQEKTGYETFQIPATGWIAGTATESNSYPNYVDIEMPGLTARDQVTIYLSPAALPTAKNCGLCPTVNVYNDELRIRAKRIPAANIPAQLWIEKGL